MSLDDTDREVTLLRCGDAFVIDAVERTVPLAGPPLAGGLEDLLLGLLLWLVWGVVAVLPCRRFKLGVVRRRADLGADHPGRVIYKQRLPRGADLDAEVVLLAAEVKAGYFDDVHARRWRPTTYASSAAKRVSPAGTSGTTP